MNGVNSFTNVLHTFLELVRVKCVNCVCFVLLRDFQITYVGVRVCVCVYVCVSVSVSPSGVNVCARVCDYV